MGSGVWAQRRGKLNSLGAKKAHAHENWREYKEGRRSTREEDRCGGYVNGDEGEAHANMGGKEMKTLIHNSAGGIQYSTQSEQRTSSRGMDGRCAGFEMEIPTKEEGLKESKKLVNGCDSKFFALGSSVENLYELTERCCELVEAQTPPTRCSDEEIVEVIGALEERTPHSHVMWAFIDGSGNVCKTCEREFGRDKGSGSKAGMGGT